MNDTNEPKNSQAMEIVNMTWVNQLRKQYLDILEYYTENPELLNDKNVNKAYCALLSVKSVEEIKLWRVLLKDYGLSFTDVDSIAKRGNMLGILDDIAEGANNMTLDVFIRWKLSFNPKKWKAMVRWNRELVDILLKATQREEDVNIIVFPCGRHGTKLWAAIGQDAERLFKVFGWQTGKVEATAGPVSWMFINSYGLKVLQNSGYSIQIRDFGEFDILSKAFEEDSIASIQQNIDYLRMIHDLTEQQTAILRKLRPIPVLHRGYKELTQASLSISKDRVVAKFEDGRVVTLAEGKNWRFDTPLRYLLVQMGAKTGEA